MTNSYVLFFYKALFILTVNYDNLCPYSIYTVKSHQENLEDNQTCKGWSHGRVCPDPNPFKLEFSSITSSYGHKMLNIRTNFGLPTIYIPI